MLRLYRHREVFCFLRASSTIELITHLQHKDSIDQRYAWSWMVFNTKDLKQTRLWTAYHSPRPKAWWLVYHNLRIDSSLSLKQSFKGYLRSSDTLSAISPYLKDSMGPRWGGIHISGVLCPVFVSIIQHLQDLRCRFWLQTIGGGKRAKWNYQTFTGM